MHRTAAILALAGCATACGYSTDEVADMPARFTMTVPAAWDVVGTCLTQEYVNGFEVNYLPVPSEQRAKVIVKLVGPGIVQYVTIMYIIDIKGGGQTTVTWRARPPNTDRADQRDKAIVERCGKA
ncbi:MAG: hypothetical protein ACK4JB_17465 [Reyranella sp.]